MFYSRLTVRLRGGRRGCLRSTRHEGAVLMVVLARKYEGEMPDLIAEALSDLL